MPIVGLTSAIEDALLSHLDSLAFVSATVEIAWPNIPFKPTVGAIWLQPQVLQAPTERADIGSGLRRHVGLLSITVHGPEGIGLATASEVADEIIEHFAGVAITANAVTVQQGAFDGRQSLPYRSGTYPDGRFTVTPVTVPWYCDAAP